MISFHGLTLFTSYQQILCIKVVERRKSDIHKLRFIFHSRTSASTALLSTAFCAHKFLP